MAIAHKKTWNMHKLLGLLLEQLYPIITKSQHDEGIAST